MSFASMEHFDVSLRNPRMNREFWTEFLDIYKSEHCLWNFKSKAYLNKTLRQRGYEKLLEFLRRGMPDATIETVKSKINTFRTNYRKQMKKLTASRLSSDCEEYEPTLWYFNCLRFLSEPDASLAVEAAATADGETLADAVDVAVDTYDNRAAETDDFTPQQLVEIVQTDEDDAIEEDESRLGIDMRSRCSSPFSHTSKASDEPKAAKRRREELVVVGEAVNGSGAATAGICNGDRVESSSSQHHQDECELFGKIWASKLRRLPENIRPFVEKQVNDIFFNVTVAMNTGRGYPPEHTSTQTDYGGLHYK
ncbi:hypothetical protein LSTR_LSTR004007 [Laodelphax striatellus]|uniref:MADF domain-containing protein n=1 Tax=Laodelphax striatellus TaxID=195883 RepID=A0A482WF70_LAOST|nr:hypothetical protein LSTR_LSTR004007 [Laodelphax striatellus]